MTSAEINSSYNRAMATIRKEIENLEKQINSLREQKNNLVDYVKQLETERDETLKQEFIKSNGITKCPDALSKNSKPKKQARKEKRKGEDTQFSQMKQLLGEMTNEQIQQLLDQYSDSSSDANLEENEGEDEEEY